MDKELRDRLYWLEDELLEKELRKSEELEGLERWVPEIDWEPAEEEEAAPVVSEKPRRRPSRAELLEQQAYEKAHPMEDRSVGVQKKKGIKGLVFLAILEILAILAIMGWWLQWLI